MTVFTLGVAADVAHTIPATSVTTSRFDLSMLDALGLVAAIELLRWMKAEARADIAKQYGRKVRKADRLPSEARAARREKLAQMRARALAMAERYLDGWRLALVAEWRARQA